mgnify:CR=1 FL=1
MNKLKAKLKKQGGFTLIEMLIVVAIIAILIAIAIPMVNSALESAREATDSANERSALGLAMVEVMTKNELAGQSVDTKQTAYYEIATAGSTGSASNMGKLVDDSTGLKPYGKGTKIGEVDEPHTGEIISVTYDPNATDEDKMYVIDWLAPGATPS